MFHVNIPACLTIGLVFSFISKKLLKQEAELFHHGLLGPFNIYITCGFVPAGMFFLTGWASWEVMYITGWLENTFDRPLVAGFYVVFYVLMIVLSNTGFILGHYWIKKGKETYIIIGIISGALLTFVAFILRLGAWWKIGTYAEIQQGMGYSFFKAPFIIGWLIIMFYLAMTTFLAVLFVRGIVKNSFQQS